MIEVSTLIRKIRFKAQDNDEVKFSDYQILNSINEVLEYLNTSYALQNSDFLEKVKEYTQEDDDAVLAGNKLPYDFLSLVAVVASDGYEMHPCAQHDEPRYDEYKLFGDKLFTKNPTFKLYYRCKLQEVEGTKDSIMLPDVFIQPIKNLAFMVLTGAQEPLQQAVDMAVESIIPRRRYANARTPMPFMIGGRR